MLDRFAPFSQAELARAAQAAPQAQHGPAATCPPIGAEDGPKAAARLLRRLPDNFWRYAMPDGATAFYVARINKPDGKKDFWPVSWADGEGWALKAWPDHRPLYKLDEITAKPGANIVICEGEKAADAAAAIFPQSIVSTSSGGAQAAAKSDWSPLAGRRILIWPDHDEAGLKYAREVAAKLSALGCEVSIIDAAALAAINPEGGAREAAAKWDAADAKDEWSDLGALRKGAVNLAMPFDPGPAMAPARDNWPDPKPLPDGLLPVAPFDYAFLPEAIAPWVRDISERMQCPPDFVGAAAMVALGSATGRKIGIRPQRKTDWFAVPSLWGCIIGRPGAMKSPAMSEALKPLNRLDAQARAENDKAAKAFAIEAELFDLPRPGQRGGLLWFISGEQVEAFGPDHARLSDERIFDRGTVGGERV